MKKTAAPKKSSEPCASTITDGMLKCVLPARDALGREHTVHSTTKPGGKPPAHATWQTIADGRIKVVEYVRGKRTAERFEVGAAEQPKLCPQCGGVQCEPGDCLYALRPKSSEPALTDACTKCGREMGEHDGKMCPKPPQEITSSVGADRLEHVYSLIVGAPGKDALAIGRVHRRALKELERAGRIEYRNEGWHPTATPSDEPDEVEIDDEPDDIDMRNLAREQRESREAHAAEVEAPTTAIARVEGQQPGMLSVERARDFLAKSKSVDEVRDVADKAKAVALYLRSRDASIESQNDAAEIRLRAERRLGELTREQPKQQGARGVGKSGVAKPDSTLTYADQGIDKRDAAKWQQLAKIPEKKFEAFVADTRAKGERLTANAPLKMVRQENKAKLADELRAKPIPQVTGRFDVIVIDPPWMYEKRAEDITQRGQIDYPPMELDAIKALPVADRAEDDCILWCWTTNAFMRDAFECLDAWGFTQKTILTWAKDRMGNGDWLRGKTEHCIMAVRGSPIVTLTNQTTLLSASVREHSRKPDEFYELVESLCPGVRLDMFGREARGEWVIWGAEADKFATEAA